MAGDLRAAQLRQSRSRLCADRGHRRSRADPAHDGASRRAGPARDGPTDGAAPVGLRVGHPRATTPTPRPRRLTIAPDTADTGVRFVSGVTSVTGQYLPVGLSRSSEWRASCHGERSQGDTVSLLAGAEARWRDDGRRAVRVRRADRHSHLRRDSSRRRHRPDPPAPRSRSAVAPLVARHLDVDRLSHTASSFLMESRCYADGMSNDLSPEAALDAAQATRRVAVGATTMPRWFPALAGLSGALGFGLLGVGALTHESGRAALVLCGLLLCVVNIAALGILAGKWLRAGVLPKSGGGASRRWVLLSTGIVPVPIAVAGLVWLVTDEVGWGSLVLGVLLGASTWWRLSAWRRSAAVR